MTVPVRWKPARLRRWISSVHVDALAGRDRLERAADELARRQALQDGVDGGEHDGGALARGRRQPGHGRHARRHDLGVGPDAVVGHRVPRRELDHAHLGGEERQAVGQRLEPPVVAGDMQQQRRRAGALLLRQPRQHQRRQPIRHSCQRLPHGATLAHARDLSPELVEGRAACDACPWLDRLTTVRAGRAGARDRAPAGASSWLAPSSP